MVDSFSLNQNDTPIASALKNLAEARVVPFDVPGHKRGKGNPELARLLGERAVSLDVNSSRHVDNLCHPISVISYAEKLTAAAFSAKYAFLMVGGTTSAVQAMILSSLRENEKIILPRNVHISVINALVLCGGIPIYVNPSVDSSLSIPLSMRLSDIQAAIDQNPDATTVFVNNPTYYGVCSDIKSIVEIAHKAGMRVLADEAHGTHLYFQYPNSCSPTPAILAGADMAAVSMHKSGGSLTQSSVLLCSNSVCEPYIRQIINLTQTTSASYILLSSLDISRRNLALNGPEIFKRVCELTDYARDEINKISGFYAYSTEMETKEKGSPFFAFDKTKLVINVSKTGLTGLEIYDILRDDFDIQAEFGDLNNLLAYVSVGDREQDIERLVAALTEIKRVYSKNKNIKIGVMDYISPHLIMSPKKAFYSEKKLLPIDECCGKTAGEFVNAYPPGIPVLSPGELVTKEIIDYIKNAKIKGAFFTGTEDKSIQKLNIVRG